MHFGNEWIDAKERGLKEAVDGEGVCAVFLECSCFSASEISISPCMECALVGYYKPVDVGVEMVFISRSLDLLVN